MLLLLKAAESVARYVKNRRKTLRVYWIFLCGAQIAIPPIRGHFVCAIARRLCEEGGCNFGCYVTQFVPSFVNTAVIVFLWMENRRREPIGERKKSTRDDGRKTRFVV